jgi:hypothetical protein
MDMHLESSGLSPLPTPGEAPPAARRFGVKPGAVGKPGRRGPVRGLISDSLQAAGELVREDSGPGSGGRFEATGTGRRCRTSSTPYRRR